MSRKPVSVSEESIKSIEAVAKKRECENGEAADHLIKVGHTRIKALATYTAKSSKPKAAKKAKPKTAKAKPAAKKPSKGKKKSKEKEQEGPAETGAGSGAGAEPAEWPDAEAGEATEPEATNDDTE